MFRLRLRWTVLLSWAVLAALYSAPVQGQGISCIPQDTRLCLQGGRFQVEVAWTAPGFGEGPGHAVPLTDDTGTFWFFDNSNVELVLKVLDGRAVNGRFWVYYGGLSDVAYTVVVTDLRTGMKEIYDNPAGRLASRADTAAFLAESPGPAPAPTASLTPAPLLRRGPEFQSNVSTSGEQRTPSVALGPDGGFMVAWWGQTSRISDYDAFGRFYDSTGKALTGEVRLNTTIPGFQYETRVAASLTGEYMAVWSDENHLFGRVFSPAGQPLGNEIRIGSTPWFQSSASIAADPAGGFLVAWRDSGESASSVPPSLRWQRFSRLGQRVGVEGIVQRPGGEINVAASPAGGFLLVWTEPHELLETNVLALLLDAEGRPLDNQALRVSTDGARRPGYHGNSVPVFHSDGGFSVVWETFIFGGGPGTPGTFARRFGAQGQPAGPVVTLPRRAFFSAKTALAELPSGGTLALWYDYGEPVQDPDGGVYGQIFDESWAPVGGRSRINTYTTHSQTEPALAVSSQGEIVAAWSSGLEPPSILSPPGYGLGTQDGDYFGVFGQRFTIASCALDSTTQLCLGGRFRVEVRFTDPRNGQQGTAHAIPLTSDTGTFWFFSDTNVELVLKVLDGRGVNGHFWAYYGALSDVRYTITVTDTLTNQSKTYNNPFGRLASRADIEAFQ